MTGAQIIVEEIIRHGVDTVFGYPGGNVIDVYDALYKNTQRLTHILTAHEQGAAHAADAYARVTGKTGVAIATSGPGATNLVTGIANAYLDSIPVVFITGNVPAGLMGRDSFQEIDIMGVTLPIVKHSYIVRSVEELARTLSEAFEIAGSGRKGPVLVDIPKSVQLETCMYAPASDLTAQGDSTALESGQSESAIAVHKTGGGDTCSPGANGFAKDSVDMRSTNAGSLDAAVEMINNSRRPYIYCGGGVVASDTGAQVAELSAKLLAPVGSSLMGLGCVPYSFEHSLGMCGMHGRYASNAAKAEADLIIALGVRFSDRATGDTQEYAKSAAVIHIDADAAEAGKNIGADIGLCGDLRDILPELLRRVGKKPPGSEWHERVRELKAQGSEPPGEGFTPRGVIKHVNAHYGPDVPVATDVGQHQMWVAQYYEFEKPRKLITSGGLGAMGFGFGAAIGACIASGRKRTVLFTSEGSFGMNLNEMATAVTYGLPITIILLNNGVLGMMRQLQTLFFDKRYSQTTLERSTHFPALAEAFGARGFRASTLAELDAALNSIDELSRSSSHELSSHELSSHIGCSGPCLIDCIIGKDEMVLPMIPSGSAFKDMLTR